MQHHVSVMTKLLVLDCHLLIFKKDQGAKTLPLHVSSVKRLRRFKRVRTFPRDIRII